MANPRWIYLKGAMFLMIGLESALLIIMENPTLKVCSLLLVSIWSFCRFYYFAFYVIERYVDSSYRFSGLWAFFKYWIHKR